MEISSNPILIITFSIWFTALVVFLLKVFNGEMKSKSSLLLAPLFSFIIFLILKLILSAEDNPLELLIKFYISFPIGMVALPALIGTFMIIKPNESKRYNLIAYAIIISSFLSVLILLFYPEMLFYGLK